ncbi:MAG: MFS transporter, partial [Flavobacteriia bacterium]|nr:MFS transporter [Flavobacteriia bacterium]
LIASGSCSMVYMAFIAVSSYIYIQFFGLSEETYSIFFAVNSLVLMVGPNIYILVRKMIPPTKIPLISYSSIFIAGILIATIGRQNEYLFLLTFMPVTLSLSFLRAFSTSTLLAQPDMNGGATSSMINFTNTALGAFGMLLTSLPWINHIVGVGSIAIISMLISGIMMLLFHRNGLKLQGYN